MGLRDILLLAVMAGLLPLCLLRPWIGVLVWTWLGLMNPHRLAYAVADLPFALAVATLTLIGLVFVREPKGIPWNRGLVLLGALFLYATATNFTAWAPEAAWTYWERVAKMVLMIYVTTMLIRGRRRIHWLLVVTALSIGFYGFKGGLFSLATGGQYRVQGPDGTMVGGNTFVGLAMAMVLPLLFALARDARPGWPKLVYRSTALLSFLAIPFTYSRGAVLGLLAVLPGIFPRLKRLVYFLPLLVGLAYLGQDLLPEKLVARVESIQNYEEDISAMQRIRAWHVSYNIAREHPLTGAGFDFEEFPDPSRWWSYVPPELFELASAQKIHVAHSIYFSVLGYHGFGGLALFLALLLYAFIDLRRLEKTTQGDAQLGWIAPYARAIRAGLVGYAVAGAFLNIAYFDLMYLFVAFTAIFRREVLAARRPAPTPVTAPAPGAAAPGLAPTPVALREGG